MSSRNTYLSTSERPAALSLYKSLQNAKESVQNKETDAKEIINGAIQIITSFPETEIDYVRICNPETLEDVSVIKGTVLMALAVKVGKTRLIDNMILI
jgi:pantoate--beta-alanine ligase